MKHHKHSIGWRRNNYQDHIGFWKEVVSFLACAAIVVGLGIGWWLLSK